MTSLFSKLSQTWRRFWSDASGAVLFYITATLPALIGFSLLAIDSSRVMTLHTSLQKGTDGLAIAAAGELDRGPNAMLRANVAIEELLANRQVFGEAPAVITRTDVTVNFYTQIPPDDATAMPTAGNTLLNPNDRDDDRLARFVEVTVNPYDINAIFPASFLGAADAAVVRTTSVAGNDSVVCKLMALFICNPFEPPGNPASRITDSSELLAAAASRTTRRRQILMRHGPGPTGYGPGNYGFLDIGNGANDIEAALAFGTPETCFIQNGVDTKPGENTGPVSTGINVRFGIFPNSMGNIGVPNPSSDWRVRPAANVRKGQDQDNPSCTRYEPEADPADGQPLPRDPCFADANCVAVGGGSSDWIGGGNWHVDDGDGHQVIADYWAANLPAGAIPPTAAEVVPSASDWTDVTRHDIYKYEIANPVVIVPTPSGSPIINLQGQGNEYGNPMRGNSCVTGSYTEADLANDVVDRRIINGAIVNCFAYLASGRTLNGQQVNVPVVGFAEFFVTEPVDEGGSGTAGDIYSEIVRVVEPGNGGTAVSFDQVQLYR